MRRLSFLRYLFAAAFACVVPVLAGGCGGADCATPCEDGVIVHFSGAALGQAGTTYKLDVEADQDTIHCTITSKANCKSTATCDSSDYDWVPCTTDEVLGTLALNTITPKSVTVHVTAGGTAVASGSFTPHYTNLTGCKGQTCREGDVLVQAN